MDRTVFALWNKIKRAARNFTFDRPPGANPVGRWVALAVVMLVAGLMLLLLVPRPEEHAASAVFYGAVIGAVVVAFMVWRTSRLTRQRTRENPGQRNFLEDRAVILASLISRGVSELASHQEELPEQLQLMARQQQNELLRQRGLWDKLEPMEKMLATSSQGTWSEEDAAMTYTWCEQLRLLRWVLGMDKDLAPLEELPEPDWPAVHATLLERFEHRKPMLAAWDVRVERDKAAEYTARALAEFAHRGQYQDETTDTSSMLRWRNFVSGTSRDLKLGSVGIGELDEQKLQLIASVASIRWQYAAYLVDLLTGDATPSLPDWEASRMEDGAPVADGTRWQ